MSVLSDRDRDPSGTASELEDRPTRPAREAAEPLDVGAALERGVVEVVERGEARGLGGITLGTLPITQTGRCGPPSPA